MIEEYISYWGFLRHPFLLAPDSKMMCLTGQYFECLERLKYAIDTGKGGVLIVSEDAGLGKTTLLMKLIEDMKERFGDAFRYAFVDHPTLSSNQMIAQITGSITGTEVGEDKLKNLNILKDTLLEAKEQGGKSIIVVDEGQMLCATTEVLQELRILINLTHNGEYLHTFILSGQRSLWHTIKGMPEFWQRLPIRYYFVPLKTEETKELIGYRMRKAGLEEGKAIFADDAMEIIHRYSRGSPRTIIALADLALLVGYTNRADRIGFKEVSKAITAMSGQGETLPYVREERASEKGQGLSAFGAVERGREKSRHYPEYGAENLKVTPTVDVDRRIHYPRPVFMVLAIVFCILAGLGGYYLASGPGTEKKEAGKVAIVQIPETTAPEVAKEVTEKIVKEDGTGGTDAPVQPDVGKAPAGIDKEIANFRKAKMGLVIAEAGNIRSAPDIRSQRIGVIFEDEKIEIIGEQTDQEGSTWYKIKLYGEKEGWISERVISLLP
jgi:general secretion pathway protein A